MEFRLPLFLAIIYFSTKAATSDDTFECKSETDRHNAMCIVTQCKSAIVQQVKSELNAAFFYLTLAAHFHDHRTARPGLAKLFYESANEERDHAISMLEYLGMRGVLYNEEFSNNWPGISFYKGEECDPYDQCPANYHCAYPYGKCMIRCSVNEHCARTATTSCWGEWCIEEITYKNALKAALDLEVKVTNNIYNIVKECDLDYHGADFFTVPILDEQHNGIRKIKGALNNLLDLQIGQTDQGIRVSEFILDQKLLKEGL